MCNLSLKPLSNKVTKQVAQSENVQVQLALRVCPRVVLVFKLIQYNNLYN